MGAMKRFSHYTFLAREESKPRVLTIGNFDGVHIGHQAVLRAAREVADRLGLELAVLTFDPHPAEILKPDDRKLRLLEPSRKAALLATCGVDLALFQQFDMEFAAFSAETFARVVEIAAPALVVAAGGPRLETNADVLQMAYDVVQAGAAGITFGRNIWQSGDTDGVIQALKRVVHEGVSVGEALSGLG